METKKILALLLSAVLMFCTVSVGVSAKAGDPLFKVTDVKTRQGEEFTVTVTCLQAVAAQSNPISALDVSLKYDPNVFTALSVTKGAGLEDALKRLDNPDPSLSLDTGNYIYSDSVKTKGEVRWSMSTLEHFTIAKNSVFAVVKFKANDASNLEKETPMTIEVTNAAKLNSDKKTFTDLTANFGPYTNSTEVAVNLVTLCDWSYNKTTKKYTLEKFNDTRATYFTIPDTFDDGTNGTHPVSAIAVSAFSNSPKIEEITLGKNMESVGSAAFMGCKNLKQVTVLSKTTKFGANAFYGASTSFVMRCIKGSAADSYAKTYNIKVEYFGDLTKCTVSGIETHRYYTGVPLEMTGVKIVNEKGEALKAGIDYSLSYVNNKDIGIATMTINGEGEYWGTLTYQFEIVCPYHTAMSGFYSEVDTYADCEAGGMHVESCSFCGYKKETPLPAKSHGACEWKVLKDATCKEEGLEACVCADCNKHIQEKPIAKTAHQTESEITPATCKATGTEKIVCTICGDVIETKTLPIVDHDKQWVTLKAATCLESGEEALTCSYCEQVFETREVPALSTEGGHGEATDWIVTIEPTCDAPGLRVKKCSVCGATLESEEISKLEHEAGTDVEIEEPSCGKPGCKKTFCIHCGIVMSSEEIPALTHEEAANWTVTKSETCTVAGEKVKYCTHCGEVMKTEVIPAPGHTLPDNWTTLTPNTCTQDGEAAKLCTVCGAILSRKKLPAAHTFEKNINVPATCTESGRTAKYCSVCKQEYDVVKINAKGHLLGEWQTVVEPTCTKAGFKQRVCTRTDCYYSETQELSPPPHKEVTEYVQVPTYMYPGTERVVCATCGKVIKGPYSVSRVFPDLNNDKSLTSADALLVLQHATKIKTLSEKLAKQADCNGDRKVNSSDALIVLQISTGVLTY